MNHMRLPCSLVQISVGSSKNIWGVNSDGNIYSWQDSNWKLIPGKLTNVCAAEDGSVWGVNSAGDILLFLNG